MFQLLATLSQGTSPASALPPQARTAVGQWALLMLLLLLALLALVTVVLVWAMWSRTRRSDRERDRPKPTTTTSAWEEAGRRLSPPLEDEAPTIVPGDERQPSTPRDDPRTRPPRAHDHDAPVALVTGAAKRVGRAVALELARAGCDVVLTYHQSYDEATELAREVSQLGRTVWIHELDLNALEDASSLAGELVRTLPRLDIVVHNASFYAQTNLDELDPADAAKHFQVNALAPLVLTTKLRPLLDNSPLAGGASVIAMSDIHADGRPRRNYSAYLMSKAALEQMVLCLARDLAPNVRVNAVALGVVAWPEQGGEFTPQEQERYLKRVPLGHAGDPADAAKAVKWLALDATYVTGAVLRVDGGRWLT
jgi:pteridine reductase